MQQAASFLATATTARFFAFFPPRAASFSPHSTGLIPFTRWLGFVWLIVGGFKLENHRRKCDRRNRGS